MKLLPDDAYYMNPNILVKHIFQFLHFSNMAIAIATEGT